MVWLPRLFVVLCFMQIFNVRGNYLHLCLQKLQQSTAAPCKLTTIEKQHFDNLLQLLQKTKFHKTGIKPSTHKKMRLMLRELVCGQQEICGGKQCAVCKQLSKEIQKSSTSIFAWCRKVTAKRLLPSKKKMFLAAMLILLIWWLLKHFDFNFNVLPLASSLLTLGPLIRGFLLPNDAVAATVTQPLQATTSERSVCGSCSQGQIAEKMTGIDIGLSRIDEAAVNLQNNNPDLLGGASQSNEEEQAALLQQRQQVVAKCTQLHNQKDALRLMSAELLNLQKRVIDLNFSLLPGMPPVTHSHALATNPPPLPDVPMVHATSAVPWPSVEPAPVPVAVNIALPQQRSRILVDALPSLTLWPMMSDPIHAISSGSLLPCF